MRGQVERRSYPVLLRIHQLPRWLLVAAVVVLLLGGIFAPRWVATGCLSVVVLFLGWLTYLAWPEGGNARKPLRILALILAVGATIIRGLGL